MAEIKNRTATGFPLSGQGYFSLATGSKYGPYLAYQLKQTTGSTSHPMRLMRYGADVGGGFLTQKLEFSASPQYWDYVPITGNGYRGWLFANPPPLVANLGFILPEGDLTLQGYGVTGIARAIPTNPLSGLGQFTAELHDLPKLPFVQSWKSTAKQFRRKAYADGFHQMPKHLADEWLNGLFGWAPFVKDIQDFYKVARDHSKIVQTYLRNSGKDVRRGSTVLKDSSSTVTSFTGASHPTLPSGLYASTGQRLQTVRTERHIYFKGAFTYYLPDGDDLLSKSIRMESLANHMYGTRLNPILLWQLTPWSWAADWLTNIGDNIHNLSAFSSDGLVMRYGYVMSHTRVETTNALVNVILKDGTRLTSSDSLVSEVKQRMKATPFGFGLNPSTFSTKQWSIIAALGISRAPRSLNF